MTSRREKDETGEVKALRTCRRPEELVEAREDRECRTLGKARVSLPPELPDVGGSYCRHDLRSEEELHEEAPHTARAARRFTSSPAAATLYALRHSFGSHLRMAGVPLANIADLMGHKDLATTQIYAKVEMAQLRDAVSRLSSLALSPETVTCGPLEGGRSRKLLKEKSLEVGNADWLGGRDSNPDSAVQSRMSYH
jgi:Phage integrase family